MSRRGSFLFPFLLSLGLSLVTGLSVLYFGIYHPKFTQFSVSVDPEKVTQELPESGTGTKNKLAATNKIKPPISTEETSDDSIEKRRQAAKERKTGAMTVKQPANGAMNQTQLDQQESSKPADINGKRPGDGTRNQSAPPSYTPNPVSEKAADKSAPSNTAGSDENPGSNENSTEDNPLIRALKSASERQNQGEQKTSEDQESRKNPFDFILNKNSTE